MMSQLLFSTTVLPKPHLILLSPPVNKAIHKNSVEEHGDAV